MEDNGLHWKGAAAVLESGSGVIRLFADQCPTLPEVADVPVPDFFDTNRRET
jgi:hypothetical protein